MTSGSGGPDDPYGILGGASARRVSAVLAQALERPPLGSGTEELPVSARPARPGDACPECARPLEVRGMAYECPSCREVFEAADITFVLPVSNPERPGAGALRGRLRVVGPEAGYYQPDLDRTNPGQSSDAQKKSTYQELLRLNVDYASRGGNPFPLDVLQDVAESYYAVQQHSVKRSMRKKGILAALVAHTCIARGFTRTRAEVAELVKLANHGIARGDDFLRSIDEDAEGPGLGLDLSCDRLGPHITTTFAHLDLGGAAFEPLRAAVAGVVSVAEAQLVGIHSVLRSRVIAATYEVLRRKGAEVTVESVATRCKIRKHTLRRFLDELAAHHSRFVAEYRRHGLACGAPSG